MIGIIISPDRKKKKILAALEEENVKHYFIDILHDNWSNEVRDETKGFLVYPPAYGSLWKVTFMRRLKYLVEKYNVIVSPSLNSIEIYEAKTAMYDFMKINEIPHPKTNIYFNYKHAKENIKNVRYPIIIKADGGSGASNIKRVKNSLEYKFIINKAFISGYKFKNIKNIKNNITNSLFRYVNYSRNKNGYIIPKDEFFSSYIIEQETINVVNEWRVIIINDSYFIHGKGKNDDGFHSGSKKKIWKINDFKVLDFAKDIIQKNNLYDISIDIFEDDKGNLFVNEIQCIFGTSLEYQTILNNKKGRYIFKNEWSFEVGDFARNGCNNLRIESLIFKINESYK